MEIVVTPLVALGALAVLLVALGIWRLVARATASGLVLLVLGLVVAGAGAALWAAAAMHFGA